MKSLYKTHGGQDGFRSGVISQQMGFRMITLLDDRADPDACAVPCLRDARRPCGICTAGEAFSSHAACASTEQGQRFPFLR